MRFSHQVAVLPDWARRARRGPARAAALTLAHQSQLPKIDVQPLCLEVTCGIIAFGAQSGTVTSFGR